MKYITTQEVNATPMNRGEYNILRNWKLPENECARDDGFLIEHIGWPPNHEGYEYYVSWVPKELFEKNYRLSETFLDRLKIEASDLEDKAHKLQSFLRKGNLKEIVKDDLQILMLKAQARSMQSYLYTLIARIQSFK